MQSALNIPIVAVPTAMFHDQNSAEKLPKKNKLFNVAVGEESNKAIGMVATDMFISLYLNVPKMKNHEKPLAVRCCRFH